MTQMAWVWMGILGMATAPSFASRVGSVGLVKIVQQPDIDFTSECYVESEGVTVRTIAGAQFDADKLIVNRKYPANGAFYGFNDLEKKFEELTKTALTVSSSPANGMAVHYQARTFDARDNPVGITLFKRALTGEVQSREDKLSKRYRAFLDAVCQ